jgi:hypothetical protein
LREGACRLADGAGPVTGGCSLVFVVSSIILFGRLPVYGRNPTTLLFKIIQQLVALSWSKRKSYRCGRQKRSEVAINLLATRKLRPLV